MIRKGQRLILFFLLVLIPTVEHFAQKAPDSLLQLLNSKSADEVYSGYMGLAEFFNGKDSAKATNYLNKVDEDIKALSDSALHNLMVRKVVFYTQEYKNAEAVDFGKLILKEATKRKDTFLIAETHKRISASYFRIYEYDSTLAHLKKAASLYKQLNDQKNFGLMIMREGGIYYAKGNYAEAMRKAFESTEIFKEIDQNLQLAHAYMQLGNIHYFLQAYQKSSHYYALASDYYLMMDDSVGWAFSYSNLGLVKIEQDSFKQGLKIQLEALPIIQKSGREISVSNSYHYIGIAYLGLKQLDSAEKYIKKSLRFNKRSTYFAGIAYDLKALGEISFNREKTDSALIFGKRAKAITDSIDNLEAKKEINLFLSKVYEAKNNSEQAYWHLKKYHELLDSTTLSDEKDIEQLAFEQQSQLERAQYELNLSHQRELLKEKENQSQQFLIIILAIVAVISIFFAGLIASVNRRNKYLNKELQKKQELLEKELDTKRALLKEIHHRVKNNLQIISSMLSIQSQYIDDERVENIFRESRSRIMSMSLIHESLYKREEAESALFSSYVKELIPQLVETYHVDKSKVNLKMNINSIELSLDDSIPCGLIINEIISNSLKHAFPNGKEGNISIEMYKEDNGTIHLKIADDGIGFPEGVVPKNQDTFGFLLLYSLVEQLEAKIEVHNKEGVSFHISWMPKEDKLLN